MLYVCWEAWTISMQTQNKLETTVTWFLKEYPGTQEQKGEVEWDSLKENSSTADLRKLHINCGGHVLRTEHYWKYDNGGRKKKLKDI